jgi:hypothetical protein
MREGRTIRARVRAFRHCSPRRSRLQRSLPDPPIARLCRRSPALCWSPGTTRRCRSRQQQRSRHPRTARLARKRRRRTGTRRLHQPQRSDAGYPPDPRTENISLRIPEGPLVRWPSVPAIGPKRPTSHENRFAWTHGLGRHRKLRRRAVSCSWVRLEYRPISPARRRSSSTKERRMSVGRWSAAMCSIRSNALSSASPIPGYRSISTRSMASMCGQLPGALSPYQTSSR